jgi:signal transduction histidine kinase
LKPSAPKTAIAIRDEHLSALSQLAGRMVHDFNNYLTPIKGYLGLFKEECAPESATLRYAGLMEKASGKIESNLEAMAAAVRPERSFRPWAVDFQKIVSESVAAWVAKAPAQAHVQVRTHLAPCLLTVDAQHWRDILFHLLENARLACASGGVVDVRLHPEKLTAEKMAELGLLQPDTFLLQVNDTGCGMAPDVLNRAFEPFFTTRSKDKASGLGLTQAYNVARLHGGQILLESQPGSGTTVSIWLPS